jgi:hypothetical protein
LGQETKGMIDEKEWAEKQKAPNKSGLFLI